MSAATRLPAIGRSVGVALVLAAAAAHPAVQQVIARNLGGSIASSSLKLLAVLVALVNFKNIPGIWHLRVFRGIIYQLYFQKKIITPKHLFAPLVTKSYNTIYDSDYNIHKSNSTYFADLDIARAHHVSALIKTSLARLNAGDREGLPADTPHGNKGYNIALGAVSCFFHKQIEVLQGFEIYTRLLCWDRKWLYIVSHMVRKGVIKPESYILQPWKKSKRRSGAAKKDSREFTKHIFATSIARYCFKRERLTINPELVLERSRLLPPRPVDVGLPPRPGESSSEVTPATTTPATPAANAVSSSPENLAGALDAKLDDVSRAAVEVEEEDDWTWEDMEAERLRGLKLASHFDALAGAQHELVTDDVLGEFGDFW